MPRLRPFSEREHMGAGALLGRVQADLELLARAIGSAYGAPFTDRMLRLIGKVEALRSDLDERLTRELPRDVRTVEGVPATVVYYGWSFERPELPASSQHERAALADLAAELLADRAQALMRKAAPESCPPGAAES